MKWRCAWCGKPHAENEPPCDECGHNAFEKAVVRASDANATDGDSGSGPESSTGAETTGTSTGTGTVDTGPDYVWTCPNCGREHVRNTPPCSRCGNPDLERVEQTYDGLERDLTAPTWFEVAKPYLPILAAIGLVIALFATGIVSPSILPGIGSPSPPDAPGDGDQKAGIDLEIAAAEIHERLDEERDESAARAYDDGLAAYAEYQNRAYVAVEFDDAEPDAADPGDFDHDCSEPPVDAPMIVSDLSVEDYPDEAAFADDVATALLSSRFGDEVRSGFDAEGIDVHVAPNDDLYVFYAAC
ncbi:hypothetical protein [Natrinema salifodinae]|uniref:Uncharacterized protein n=1 Tax=Natrinema salifodinae TaxID=1202768 RepID=A0A1I0QXU2_9EURY|nr:hypothetical protein [Natrinema salifodinae]SEW32554.1 hypothetical protein SAMN05216285_4129 [Natrinema salifodinae]